MRKFADVDELRAAVGEDLGTSEWVLVDQERINVFADATDDHQWIHVDPERAKAESPFGGPIAHGYLTLSLLVPLLAEVLVVSDAVMGVNYGLNKLRFPSPVPVGSRVRGHCRLVEVTDVPHGVQATLGGTVEIEGWPKPACVAEVILRYMH